MIKGNVQAKRIKDPLERYFRGRFLPRHGMHSTRTYSSWQAMTHRCTCENDPFYEIYGGRGITVCERWLYSFKNFLEDMGKRPAKHTLGRINNQLGYFPDNCHWENIKQQQSNRSTTRFITYGDQTMHIADWSRSTVISPSVIRRRLDAGWPIAQALFQPTALYKTTKARKASALKWRKALS